MHMEEGSWCFPLISKFEMMRLVGCKLLCDSKELVGRNCQMTKMGVRDVKIFSSNRIDILPLDIRGDGFAGLIQSVFLWRSFNTSASVITMPPYNHPHFHYSPHYHSCPSRNNTVRSMWRVHISVDPRAAMQEALNRGLKVIIYRIASSSSTASCEGPCPV